MGLPYNQITEIPPEIGEMKQIIALNLNYNQITALPEELTQLATLKGLYLTGNPIDYFDPEIKRIIKDLETKGVKVVK